MRVGILLHEAKKRSCKKFRDCTQLKGARKLELYRETLARYQRARYRDLNLGEVLAVRRVSSKKP